LSEIIFGIHPVLEALRSGKDVERLYLGKGKRTKAISDIQSLAKARRIECRFEPWERLSKRIDGNSKHQGIVAVCREAFSYASLEDIFARIETRKEAAFLLILDRIQDPHNLGAILRTAECAGVHGVILARRNAAEVTPTAVKVSAGAAAYIPVCRVTNIVSTIESLKKRQIWVVGTSGDAEQQYTASDLTVPLAVVIGNEEKGMRRLVAEKCDFMVSIPMYGKISSLNASISSALMMFEVRRQRSA
jgi:23S rRNA (guanosine2251-2'-O)-methyltransferase